MQGLINTFSWVLDPLNALLGVGFTSFGQWLGSCINGSCDVLTDVGLKNIFNALASILDFLQQIATTAWLGIFMALPSGGHFPPVTHSAAVYFGNALQSVAFMLPVDVMVWCLTFSLNVFMGLWAFHTVRSIVYFVRGINSERYNISDGPSYGGANQHRVFGDSRF